MLSRLFLALLFLQNPKPGSVSGTVVNSVTGAPVRKAHVTLEGSAGTYTVTTDAAGVFKFAEVNPWTYFLRVEGTGVQPFHEPEPMRIAEDQHVDNVAVKLTPLGVITGRVLDENGEPLARMVVEARAETFGSRGRTMNTATQGATDDRGQYRMFDLPAGRYSVVVFRNAPPPGAFTVGRGRLRDDQIHTAYVTTWFPGVTDPSQAAMSVLAPGGELTLDVRLRKVPVFHIRGSAAAPGAPLRLTLCDPAEPSNLNVPILRDGTFEAAGIPRGMWCLLVSQSTDNTHGIFGRQTVSVTDHDVNDVTVPVLPTVEVRGQMLIDGAAPAQSQSIPFRLDPVGNNGRTVGVGGRPDGTFSIPNLPPDTYKVVVQGFGMYLKSLRFNGQEVPENRVAVPPGGGQLTVLLGTDSGEIGGTAPAGAFITAVQTSSGEVGGRGTSLPNGTFVVRGLPPGDYQVLAWETHETGLAEYSEFRNQFQSRAVVVTVTAKGHVTASDLKPITAAEIEEAKGRMR